jgi:hypothetical protein
MARVKKIGAVGDMVALVPVPENPGLEHTMHYLAGLSCEIDKTFTPEQHKAAKRMYDTMVASLSGGKAAGLNVQTHVLIIALLQLLKRV